MTITTASSTATASVYTPTRNAERYQRHRLDDDDLSSTSSENYGYIQCASPSSIATRKSLIRESLKGEDQGPSRRLVGFSLPPKKTVAAVLQRLYGNADVLDCIGRTLSFLLLARLVLSFLFATILDE